MMMAQMNRVAARPAVFIVSAAIALCVTACGAFGPQRNPPKMPATVHYSVDAEPAQLPTADGIAQRLDLGERPVPQWWTAYGSDELHAVVQEGLANSPSLAAAQHTLKAAREALRSQIGQSMVPSVDVGFDPSSQRALGIPILPQEQTFQYDVFAAEVQTSYTFDFFGAAVLANRALALQVKQQAYQLEAPRRALAANIVVAAINAASLQEQAAATEQLVAAGEARARQVAARYRLGGASHDDVLAAEQGAAGASGDPAGAAREAARGASCTGGAAGAHAGSGARALGSGHSASSGACACGGAFRPAASAAGHTGGRSQCPRRGG